MKITRLKSWTGKDGVRREGGLLIEDDHGRDYIEHDFRKREWDPTWKEGPRAGIEDVPLSDVMGYEVVDISLALPREI